MTAVRHQTAPDKGEMGIESVVNHRARRLRKFEGRFPLHRPEGGLYLITDAAAAACHGGEQGARTF